MKEKTVNEAASAMARARWQKVSAEERKKSAQRIAKMPRVKQRCFCGATSMINAAHRYFDCCRKAGIITLNLEKKGEKHDEPIETGT